MFFLSKIVSGCARFCVCVCVCVYVGEKKILTHIGEVIVWLFQDFTAIHRGGHHGPPPGNLMHVVHLGVMCMTYEKKIYSKIIYDKNYDFTWLFHMGFWGLFFELWPFFTKGGPSCPPQGR